MNPLQPPYNIDHLQYYYDPDHYLDAVAFQLNGQRLTMQRDLFAVFARLVELDNKASDADKSEFFFIIHTIPNPSPENKDVDRLYSFYVQGVASKHPRTLSPDATGWFFNPTDEQVESQHFANFKMPDEEPVFAEVSEKDEESLALYDMDQLDKQTAFITNITRALMDNNHEVAHFLIVEAYPNHKVSTDLLGEEPETLVNGKPVDDWLCDLERDLISEFGEEAVKATLRSKTASSLLANPIVSNRIDQAINEAVNAQAYQLQPVSFPFTCALWTGPNDIGTDLELSVGTFTTTYPEAYTGYLLNWLTPDQQEAYFKQLLQEQSSGMFVFETVNPDDEDYPSQVDAVYPFFKLDVTQFTKAYISDQNIKDNS